MNFAKKIAGILQKWPGNDKMSRDFEKNLTLKKREKFGKLQEFPEFVRNFIRSFHFFNHLLRRSAVARSGTASAATPPVSLGVSPIPSRLAAPTRLPPNQF